MTLRSSRPGFTLIELLLVIGIIAILASIVIVAINPVTKIGDARDVTRKEDVTKILNAVYAYTLDNNGDLPKGIPTDSPKVICQSDVTPDECTAKLNGISLGMLTGAYITTIPKDPLITATGTGTRYTIIEDSSGRITVAAPGAERTQDIHATR